MAGDFVIPALELGLRGSFVSSFGVPLDGGRLSSNFGLGFTLAGGVGFTVAGGCAGGTTARGRSGLTVEVVRGGGSENVLTDGGRGKGPRESWDGSMNCRGAAMGGGAGAGAGATCWGIGAGWEIGVGWGIGDG